MAQSQKRKLRLLEAMQQDVLRPDITVPIKLSPLPAATTITALSTGKHSKILDEDTMKTMEMKLKILENWEVTKFKAIERLALEVEALQEIEETIEQREAELAERGMIIEDTHQYASLTESKNFERNNTTPTSSQLNKRPRILHSNSEAKPATWRYSRIKTDYATTDEESEEVTIGPNGTKVSRVALNAINWSLSGAGVTRKILMEVFDRETLAFHTLTGKPSPAFMDCDKPHKNQLDIGKVADIVYIITQNLNMTAKDVRSAITTKCADENKMFRQREKKRQR